MKTSIDQLTDLELKTYNNYNLILKLCQTPKSNDDMARQGLKYIRNTITYKCKHLIKYGYLEQLKGKSGRAIFYQYQSIKDHYPIQEYLDFINAKHYNQVGMRHKIVERMQSQEPKPEGHAVRMAEIEAKQHETARLDRLNRKRQSVYVGISPVYNSNY